MNSSQRLIITAEPNTSGWTVQLAPLGGIADHIHVFDEASRDAINTAILAGRPLLVRGEPGVGKSQLARAAAKSLGYAFISHTVDIKTEAQDLMWRFDAVRRLAEAQLHGTLEGALAGCNCENKDDKTRKTLRDEALKRLQHETNVSKFLVPGPLWWAFNWNTALDQAANAEQDTPPQPDKGDSNKGCVLLIDEIDKAETDVPNGLLEALGSGQFPVLGHREPVRCGDRPLLVIITSNEERALPDAFIRRCMCLHMELPEDPQNSDVLIQHLVDRGTAHFKEKIDGDVYREAAKQLVKERNTAHDNQIRPLPGQAEYLDLLRALANHPTAKTKADHLAHLDRIKGFALQKTKGRDGM